MADYRAVGAVSLTLRKLLTEQMDVPPDLPAAFVPPIPVAIGIPPNEGEEHIEGPLLNLFLYRITENASLKNQDIPGHETGGYTQKPLALDLHYLLTAYGLLGRNLEPPVNDEHLAQWILGDAMRVLNDFAIVPRTTLHTVLGNEFEHLRVVIEPLSLEDISKVWTALSRPFRLSVAYSVTVVQIESELPRSYPRPVGPLPNAGPRNVAVTGTTPLIAGVHASGSVVSNARIGDVLVIEGSGLYGDHIRVEFDDVDAGASVTSARDAQLSVVVPDDPRLQPGPHTVRVVKDAMVGNPPTPRAAFTSNTGAFLLVPRIDTAIQLGGPGGNIEVKGARLFTGGGMSTQTVIGDVVVDGSAYTTAISTRIVFPVAGAVAPGKYVVRVRVNGAESIDGTVLAVA